MRILITGATGAIGFELLNQLKSEKGLSGVTVLVRDSKKNRKKLKPFQDHLRICYGDITDSKAVEDAVTDQEMIIHLAAVIPPFSEDHPERGYAINLGGTENMISAIASKAPNAFLLFTSSVVVYGDRIKNPMISVADEIDQHPHDLYGIAKIKCEELIRNSSIDWCILRLTAIMGVGNHKISGIMFDVPLETPMEIATVKDTARALKNAIDKKDQLSGKIFNLSGGEKCRLTYKEFLERSFDAFGMGKVNFPKHAFAFQNFHCGYYSDADDLEKILAFRSDDLHSYFRSVRSAVPFAQRIATVPFAGMVKRYLLSLSKPYKAYKKGDKDKIDFYFGKL